MASEEEYSDLTELDSEEEYQENPSKKGKKAPAKKGGWKIKNALKVPRATTYTAQALYDQIYGCDINLEPEYQRDVVWSEAKQIGIIDSVLRNFYIPPVIFAVNVQDDGSETKTCIDGKQRLTSIHKFMEGLIPHKDPITSEKLWYKDIPGPGHGKRKLLPEKYRRIFANKQIVCVEYQDITDNDEREIFQRVQLGMALTPAEKLQVVKTPRADFVRDLQSRYLKDDGWLGPKHLAWDVSRGSDFRGIAYAINQMDTFTKTKTGLMGMPQLEKWLSVDEPLKPEMKTAMENTFHIFAEMVQDNQYNKVLKNPSKISPVEFIAISLLIFAHKDKVSLAQLSAGIKEMRENVRKIHVDIRMNTRVSKTMFDFIRQWTPKKQANDTGEVASAVKSVTGTKRKRAAKEDAEMDDDEEGDEDVEMADGDDNVAEYEPKAKKKNTGKPANAHASTSKAATSTQPTPSMKEDPSPPPMPTATLPAKPAPAPAPTVTLPAKPAPAPTTDRMAALKQVKDQIARDQAERAKQIPSAPRAFRESIPNPQMLPSPTQAQGFSTSSAGAYGGPGNLGRAPLPGSSGARTMYDGAGESMSASVARQGNLPPPPGSGASTASGDGAYRNGDWDRPRDRDRDREYERERERSRDTRYPRTYDERDRSIRDDVPREPSRRDSGFAPREPLPGKWPTR